MCIPAPVPRWILSLLLLSMSSTLVFGQAAAHADVIITMSGDKITGEIKKMEHGVISIDPDYGNNIFELEWDQIERIESQEMFVIETSSGARMSGKIRVDSASPRNFVIQTESGTTASVKRSQIVRLQPLQPDFWSRLSGGVDVGGSVTKAAGSRQLNVGSRLTYLARRWQLANSFDWNYTALSERRTNRGELDSEYLHLVGQQWFAGLSANFLKSDELELKLRSTLSPGAGRYLTRTNDRYWSVSGGLQWIREQYQDPLQLSQHSGEAWASTELNLFDFDDLALMFRLKASPSFTERDRVRVDFRSDLKYDLPKDFYFRIGLSDNFDSRPRGDSPRNDYVFSFGFGWKL